MRCAGTEKQNPPPAHASRGLIYRCKSPLRRAAYDYRNYYDEDRWIEHDLKYAPGLL